MRVLGLVARINMVTLRAPAAALVAVVLLHTNAPIKTRPHLLETAVMMVQMVMRPMQMDIRPQGVRGKGPQRANGDNLMVRCIAEPEVEQL